MAETDILYEFGREPGFSSLVYSPDSSHMLHLFFAFSFEMQGKCAHFHLICIKCTHFQ